MTLVITYPYLVEMDTNLYMMMRSPDIALLPASSVTVKTIFGGLIPRIGELHSTLAC
jgi:hypothetical protein